jgi:hypothetical protein
VVASPALKRALWIAVSTVCVGIVLALAAHGRRPESGLVRFEAAGVMLHIAPDQVVSVTLMARERRWRFSRGERGGWRVDDSPGATLTVGAPAPAAISAAIDTGVRFLHVSAPARRLSPAEISDAASEDFGLSPPRYTVEVRAADGRSFSIDFGVPNAQGLAQYTHVAGTPEVALLPRFVGEAWESATAAR